MHTDSHELAGATVILNDNATDHNGEVVPGVEYRIEDYWDKLTGGSWMTAFGNPAVIKYAVRTDLGGHVPLNDEVVYGKIGAFGHLVHVSELGDVKE